MSGPHEYHWTFGNRCHIEFPNGGNPIVRAPHAFNTDEGCASISDSNGNLLFYTDGDQIFDSLTGPAVVTGLGGHNSSANSGIIVPPAGGGDVYHVFATYTSSSVGANPPIPPATKPLRYVGVKANTTGITWSSSTQGVDVIDPDFGSDWGAGEALGATSHADCSKYWVVGIDAKEDEWVVILIDSDTGPTPANLRRYDYNSPTTRASNVYGMKFSHDGSMIAIANLQHNAANPDYTANRAQSSFDLFNFDRATGAITFHSQVTDLNSVTEIVTNSNSPYGLEFSPNLQYLYMTNYQTGSLYRHTIGASVSLSSCAKIYDRPHPLNIGALQLAPNGRIYGTNRGTNSLFSINNPDAILNTPTNMASNQTDLGFEANAITLPTNAELGLPTFTRIADDCLEADVCSTIASEVNEVTSERAENDVNRMRPCEGRLRSKPTCREFRHREPSPHIEIKWGDSECDCIESDDTETVSITVCNTYSNIEFSSFTIHKLEVVDAAGNPVATLPDGTPSVELTPIGPYCFGDIASCSCVSREFVLRNRGAIAGEYHIRATGICYDVNLHFDDEACFKFDICAD